MGGIRGAVLASMLVATLPSLAQDAFRIAPSLGGLAEHPLEASLDQAASHIGRDTPLQLFPVLAVNYRASERWSATAAYDFESLAFAVHRRLHDEGASWRYGLSFGLSPELRSFSWKFGPWISRHALGGNFTGLIQVASLNAWGYGLWSRELEAAAGGRAWVVPVQIFYEREILERLEVRVGFEAQFGSSVLRNHFSAMLGLAKGWQ